MPLQLLKNKVVIHFKQQFQLHCVMSSNAYIFIYAGTCYITIRSRTWIKLHIKNSIYQNAVAATLLIFGYKSKSSLLYSCDSGLEAVTMQTRPQWSNETLALDPVSFQSLEKTTAFGLFFSMAAWADLITSSVWSMLMFQFAWTQENKHFQSKQNCQRRKSFKSKVLNNVFVEFSNVKRRRNNFEQRSAGQQSDVDVTHRSW